jgi:YegS/Rv2252/BmrU family lipid kinase
MNENNKVLFIINKHAGTGYRKDVEGTIISMCEPLDLECVIEFPQGADHARELAKTAQERKVTRVFAVGGDGTVNLVAQGLVNGNIPLGIIPKGSGNGLARHLGIPMNFRAALQLIPSSHIISMDTFLINRHLSVNVSGIGFDGHIASLFGRNGRGLVNYGRLVIKEFIRFKEATFEVFLDEVCHTKKSFILAIANSSQFGNNARIAPLASVTDQELDICFVKKMPLTHTIGFVRKMFTNRLHHSSFVETMKGKKFKITTPRPLPYHVDGEAMPKTDHFEIEVQPASLQVIVPEHQR